MHTFRFTPGYVAIDGISLTVADRSRSTFSIMMIPHTQQSVTLSSKEVGDTVNIEAHVLGKYIVAAMNNSYGSWVRDVALWVSVVCSVSALGLSFAAFRRGRG